MFNPAFQTSQTIGSPTNVNFTDVSTGSDSAIVARRVYLQVANGTFLVVQGTSTDWNAWALVDTSVTFNLLTQDQACLVTVEWVGVSGQVLYSSQQYAGYTLYEESLDYQLTQWLAANPLNINDNYYWNNKSELRDCIDSGNQAIEFFSDLYAAQQCYNRGMDIVNDAQNLFNVNT